MATFAKSTFSPVSYAAFRPTYPASLYSLLLSYHTGPRELALDLGCGPGTATRPLSAHFTRIIGLDPSTSMLSSANKSTLESNITYAVCPAEDLSSLQTDPRCRVFPGEVDFIGAGQAVHWFDKNAWFAEMYKYIRPKGTLAYWGYSDPGFKDHPKATEILRRYAYNQEHTKGVGRYWPEGRETVRNLNRSIVPPEDMFKDVKRVEYECMKDTEGMGERMMFKKMTMGEVVMYMTSWSSWQEWKDANPGSRSRFVDIMKGTKESVEEAEAEANGDVKVKDVLDGCIQEIFDAEGWDLGTEVELEWDSSVVMARRKD